MSAITIPRLSDTLQRLTWPFRCQRCDTYGGHGVYERLTVWKEHDDADKPEMIFVVLCPKCAAKVIDPHPRLYARLGFNEPAPGVMRVCVGCRHRVAARCGSPMAMANGGPGLTFPAPDSTLHLSCQDKYGRRYGRWEKWWDEEPSECKGFEPTED